METTKTCLSSPLVKSFVVLRGHRSLGRGSGPKEVTGCPLRTVVTMNCPVPSSALFLCGCFGVTPLHRNIVKNAVKLI